MSSIVKPLLAQALKKSARVVVAVGFEISALFVEVKLYSVNDGGKTIILREVSDPGFLFAKNSR